MPAIRTGLENLGLRPPRRLAGKRLGLLCNPASVNRDFVHASHVIDRVFPGRLTALFAPQHGFFAEKQDNMVESEDFYDSRLSVPVFSLYGETRIPTDPMLDQIDVLLVDLQDAGTRVYTFFTTLSYCMEAAARTGKAVFVLDRPNPLGGMQVEGNCLDPEYASFVGRYPIPMRHGLTIGEFARFINETYGIGCELEVIPMQGWQRWMYFTDTGLCWIAPSPNLPTPASAMVYPGQVLWEGTNLSEGRGTTQPFEIFGAPFVDAEAVLERLPASGLAGVVLRPLVFEPTSGKWAGRACRGFQLHVTDREKYLPYRTSLILLDTVRRLFTGDFAWKPPPYEYEWQRPPFDLISGEARIRLMMEAGRPIEEICRPWPAQLAEYLEQVRPFYLYPQHAAGSMA